MNSPFFVTRLLVFLISALLLADNVEPGWGVQPAWGWYTAIILLSILTFVDMLSFLTMILAFLLLIGGIDESRAVFVAMTVLSGFGVLRRLAARETHSYYWRSGSWRWGPPAAE